MAITQLFPAYIESDAARIKSPKWDLEGSMQCASDWNE